MKTNQCVLGPLTQCGCGGDQRECSEGRYWGNDARTPCKYFRDLGGLINHCASFEARAKKRKEENK